MMMMMMIMMMTVFNPPVSHEDDTRLLNEKWNEMGKEKSEHGL